MKCKLKKIISCLIGDTKSSLAAISLYSWHLSFERIEHKGIFEHKRYITFKKQGLKTIEHKKQ